MLVQGTRKGCNLLFFNVSRKEVPRVATAGLHEQVPREHHCRMINIEGVDDTSYGSSIRGRSI